jgi:NSS family neurotransmitter:Na+ symporter
MVSEFIIGRHAQTNTARAYTKLSNGTAWRWTGYLGVLTGFLITGYYAVVSGWCLEYIYASIAGHLKGDAHYVESYFAQFSQNPWKPVVWMLLFFGITHWVITRGVEKGIERASKLMMPTLFILLLIIVGASCSLPGAGEGIKYLFHPDFSAVSRDVFLGALGQSFYSLSIAMGCLCTYASYFSRSTNLTQSAIQISIIDCMVAILAGLMIFPAAFSVGVNPGSGASLVFITLPNVFNQAFAAAPLLGTLIALLFYALLSLAALTSLMSLHEVSTAFFHEELKTTRRRGAAIVTISCAIIGTFCSLSLGGYDSLQVFGMPLFDLFDFVTGQLFLPIGGFLTCLFLGWYVPRGVVQDEFTNGGTLRSTFFGVYLFSVRYVCPLCILLIFLHQFGLI